MHLQIKTVIPVIEENKVFSSPEPKIGPVNLINTFLATSIKLDKKAESNTSSAGMNKKTKNIKYIACDIAEEALKTYQTNAFLEKTDLKLSYGELASKSYDKLKEILNIAERSALKLDGKGFLKSLGTELLAQEDVLFFTLPSASKDDIKNIKVYSFQSNGFCLTISVSKYLFDNTIIMMDLQDIEISKTVEGFSKVIKAVKIVLS
ncbi:17907_t:CDS:2 [Funneliformis caledonium]|uniref:17907_t:CDS:1 n=1 Tax=Funneliformis caledonium TaxID=1117310 RepID=A0A9N9BRI6_9GLOM|nr:17907_t:CDS:2 [Funneliformis caledonium]